MCFTLRLSSTALVSDILYVSRSLGFNTAVYLEKNPSVWGPLLEGIAAPLPAAFQTLRIRGPRLETIPTLTHAPALSAQGQRPSAQVLHALLTPICVEPVGVGAYYGFTLDGNHRYLLGDFTVTHNTWSYLLGCVDYIVRGTHFQRGLLQPASSGAKAILVLPSVASVLHMQALMTEFSDVISEVWAKNQMDTRHHHPHLYHHPLALPRVPGARLVKFVTLLQAAQGPLRMPSAHAVDIILTTPTVLKDAIVHQHIDLACVKYFIMDDMDQITDPHALHLFAEHVSFAITHLPFTKVQPLKVALFSRTQSPHLDFLIASISASLKSSGLLRTAFHDAYLRITAFPPLPLPTTSTTATISGMGDLFPPPPPERRAYPPAAVRTDVVRCAAPLQLLPDAFYGTFLRHLQMYLRDIRHSFLALGAHDAPEDAVESLLLPNFQGPHRLLVLLTATPERAHQLAVYFHASRVGHDAEVLVLPGSATAAPAPAPPSAPASVLPSFAMVVMTTDTVWTHAHTLARWLEHRQQVFVLLDRVPAGVQAYHRLVLAFVVPSVALCVDGCVKLSFAGKVGLPTAFVTLYHPQDTQRVLEIQAAVAALRA